PYSLTHPSRVERLALVGALVPGCGYRPSWIYRLVALRGLGEVLSCAGHARLYKAALARCFHAPDRREVDFFVDYEYATRTDATARAAYLTTLRSEEHTSELQSRFDLVCRLLLETTNTGDA